MLGHDGKAVSKESLAGEVVRIGRRGLAARLARPLAPLTNVRLRMTYPASGHESAEGHASGDLYGKVTAGGTPTLIRLTSVDTADQHAIVMLLHPGTARAAGSA